MKKTWFHGLAIALGATALPGIASAQYTIGNNGGGLSASSFNAQGNYQSNSGIRPLPPARGQANLAGYAQSGNVGSGISDHVHVPESVMAHENPVLNSQYQGAAQPVAPVPQPYEQSLIPQSTPQPSYGSPYAAPAPSPMPSPVASSGMSSCPACNSGSCATHGVGVSPMISSSPMYFGGGDSCYGETVSAAPSVVSPSPWIFGASGLLFNRIDDYKTRLTSDPYMPTSPLLSTNQAAMRATGGVQLSAGRYFGCGRYALIGTYWGVFSNPQTYTVMPPPGGALRSNLPFTIQGVAPGATPYGITMPGSYVYDWYDQAAAHRLIRDQEFHNVEVNLFSFALGGGARQPYAPACNSGCGGGYGASYGSCDPCGSSCAPVACSSPCGGPTGPCAPWYGAQCSKLRLNMFGGVRWFRFRDSFEYDTSRYDTMFGGADDFYYRNGVTNDLVGFQLGSMATWCTGTRFNFFGSTAFGVYGNHMQANTFAGTNAGAATILSTNSFNGMPYDYSTTKNDVAFLGEGNLGMGVCLCKGLTANIGYRVVGVSGVATAIGQIPRDFSLGNDVNSIHNDRSLILHGLVLGATYNF